MKEIISLTLDEVIALATMAGLNVQRTNYSRSKRDIIIADSSNHTYKYKDGTKEKVGRYCAYLRGLDKIDGMIPLNMSTPISDSWLQEEGDKE